MSAEASSVLVTLGGGGRKRKKRERRRSGGMGASVSLSTGIRGPELE